MLASQAFPGPEPARSACTSFGPRIVAGSRATGARHANAMGQGFTANMRLNSHGRLRKLNGSNHSPTASTKKSLCLLLVAVLLVGVPGLATVLCVSPNGHTALEALNALCCPSGKLPRSTSYPPSSAPGQLSQPGSCGNCTDVPILAATDRNPAVSLDSKAAPASPALVSLNIQFSATTLAIPSHTSAFAPASENQTASALRSVSLRC